MWVAVAAVAAIGALAIATRTASRGDARSQAFRVFWEPVFCSADPLPIAVGNPIV
jgi:hypothetical protein